MKPLKSACAFTLVETMVSLTIFSMVGLMLFSIFYTGSILGAKNTAINTAHQQARVAMLNMLQDIHGAVSQPQLTDANGSPYPTPTGSATPVVNGAGISFQQWASGPHKIRWPAAAGQNQIILNLTGTEPTPAPGQHLVIPDYQIEGDILSVSGGSNNFVITLQNIYGPYTPQVTYPASTLPIGVLGAGSSAGDVVCFVTDRCSYTVSNNTLNWNRKGNTRVASNDITNSTPFSIPTTNAGAPYHRFVAAIDLSTSDANYSNRGYKSANILLNGQIPQKARLTTFQ